jgi:hypothetical protein
MAVGAIGGSAAQFVNPYSRPTQAAGQVQLTPEQQQEVQKLKSIDQKVHEHEAAHQAAGAGLTSGANYEYVRGPDGKQYAVAGDVKIDVSPAQTPQQTIDKAKRIEAAALAPADPSAQDRAVAAQAAQMALQAQAELNRLKNGGESGPGNQGASASQAIVAYTSQDAQPTSALSLFA